MRNIFLFIRRYFNFLFFLVLQIIALSFLFRYNKFHEAAFMGVANEITGRIGDRYNNVEYYFHLKKTNEALARENENLLNRLRADYDAPDSSSTLVNDTIRFDTLEPYRKYRYRSARIVNNSLALQNNYITIHRGENQGVKKDMGVISPQGFVGTVMNTSENFAVVMSLFNRQSNVSARLKKTGELGKIQWEGETVDYVSMVNVPKSVQVAKGDTIVTSGYSLTFPYGITIGTVISILDEKSSNFYVLKVKPATNFFNVQYVNVIENLQKEEQKKLEDASKKNQ
ncbi:MAG TPA: rod shape-determining protein MreC [Flavitalea sp.]|nr:rod shape-determining protein MreC [Flavitalea sp.]